MAVMAKEEMHLLSGESAGQAENSEEDIEASTLEIVKSPESTGLKSTARRVVLGVGLLLVVAGIFVVMFVGLQQSSTVSKPSSTVGLAAIPVSLIPVSSADFHMMSTIDQVLHEAELMEHGKTQQVDTAKEAGEEMDRLLRRLTPVEGIEQTESELETAMESGETSGAKAAFNDVLSKYRGQIRTAMEEVSEEMEPEQAAEKDMLITSQSFQKVNGLDGTPELAVAADGKGDDALEGDMIFESAEAKQRLLQEVHGRRLWAGLLWPDKSAIPYCFDAEIAAASKAAFLHSCAHLSDLVPCIGFKKVAVKDAVAGTCEEGGIYVQSKMPGCWSYVGKSALQHLNLQPAGCDSMGIATHEVLHALGTAHEQARPDFAEYVTILWDNIQPSMAHNYAMNPNADAKLPYDIMSLMHYGETDFAIPGTITMIPKGSHRGLMGNRMGLTKYDAEQLADMYQCDFKKYSLCTNDPDKCTHGECMCHQDPAKHGSVVKIVEPDGCQRCMPGCLDAGSTSCSMAPCGCSVGFTKITLTMVGGGECYQCKAEPSSAPPVTNNAKVAALAPAPPPAPPSQGAQAAALAPAVSSFPCKFPTSPDDCESKNMPGCTTCDGDTAWCFTEKGDGDWRHCTKDDNACYLPFSWKNKTYYDCTYDDSTTGVPWCYKVGGGWKHCTDSDGFEDPNKDLPTEEAHPSSMARGCKFPYSWKGITYTNGCVKGTGEFAGKDWCIDHDDHWRICENDEDLCSFPMVFAGKNYTECTKWGETLYCDTVGGGWKYC